MSDTYLTWCTSNLEIKVEILFNVQGRISTEISTYRPSTSGLSMWCEILPPNKPFQNAWHLCGIEI